MFRQVSCENCSCSTQNVQFYCFVFRFEKELERQRDIYTKGCVGQFEKWLQDNLIFVAGIFVGIALLQVRLLSRHLCFLNSCKHKAIGPSVTSSGDRRYF